MPSNVDLTMDTMALAYRHSVQVTQYERARNRTSHKRDLRQKSLSLHPKPRSSDLNYVIICSIRECGADLARGVRHSAI